MRAPLLAPFRLALAAEPINLDADAPLFEVHLGLMILFDPAVGFTG
jgi:hypothetical protein